MFQMVIMLCKCCLEWVVWLERVIHGYRWLDMVIGGYTWL